MSEQRWRPLWLQRKRRRWSRDVIVRSIQALREAGADLSYSGVSSSRGNLHRAAVRHFGSWRGALAAAGVDPETVRRRRRWTNAVIVERIRQLAERGFDLSWTAVAHGPNRALAAAAVRKCHFGSWRAALGAAGVRDAARARRVGRWDAAAVLAGITRRRVEGLALNAKAVEEDEPALITAARRRFGSWHEALRSAGVNPDEVALRNRQTAVR